MKRFCINFKALLIMNLVAFFLWNGSPERSMNVEAAEIKQKHILLLGASIGKEWNFPALPQRAEIHGYTFEYIGVGTFDKSEALNDVLSRKENKPDAIILKECATYFPGDLEKYKGLIKKWVEQSLEANVVPVLATVAPITKRETVLSKIKGIIKSRLLGQPDRIDEILKYNDWIRHYAAEKKMNLVDLEASLRISETDRHLRPDMHSGDGLHLNEDAYLILDKIVVSALGKI